MDEARHSPLSAAEQSLLARLADPERPVDDGGLTGESVGLRMLSVARQHGVLPIVWRKLRSATVAGDAFAQAMAEAADTVAVMAGHSLLLRHHARTIEDAFKRAGISAAIIKGPVFAERLYKVPADRPFTDIDLLIAPNDLAAANAALPQLGFVALTKAVWDKSDSNQEYKWGRTDNPNILIELHGNLVHYASFRRLLSYSYDDLLLAGDGDPTAPAALLMTSVIHAACGHKFHRLQFAVDIVQGARALPDIDLPMLERAARSIGAELELAVSLHLAGRIFDDRRTLGMAERFSSGAFSAVSKRLISPAAIHNATSSAGGTSHLRRKTFRGIQLLSRIGRTRG
jgi:hypothetical protein